MARRWRTLGSPIEPDIAPAKTMVEHSIIKHNVVALPAIVHSTSTHTSANTTRWSKEVYDKYIVDMKARGFVIGAPCITKYGIPGVIESIRDITPDKHITFFGIASVPCTITIKRADQHSGLLYSESEITLIK
jgi:hypothetical protein